MSGELNFDYVDYLINEGAMGILIEGRDESFLCPDDLAWAIDDAFDAYTALCEKLDECRKARGSQ